MFLYHHCLKRNVFQASNSSGIFLFLTTNCSLFCHIFIHSMFGLWLYWTTFLPSISNFLYFFLIDRRNICFLHHVWRSSSFFFPYTILNKIHFFSKQYPCKAFNVSLYLDWLLSSSVVQLISWEIFFHCRIVTFFFFFELGLIAI